MIIPLLIGVAAAGGGGYLLWRHFSPRRVVTTGQRITGVLQMPPGSVSWAAPSQLPIRTPVAGTVVSAGRDDSEGTVTIAHTGGYRSTYTGNSAIQVYRGQQVQAGQQLMGHYRLQDGRLIGALSVQAPSAQYVDAEAWLNQRGARLL